MEGTLIVLSVPPSFQVGHDKPTLTACLTPVVPQGQHVTLHLTLVLDLIYLGWTRKTGLTSLSSKTEYCRRASFGAL
jgi:hypothetical protein